MHTFCWYELRTTDLPAARAFYADVVGLAVSPDLRFAAQPAGIVCGEITTVPARAAAMGAPAHWLGHIGVADVDAAVRRFVALGAQQLGATETRADGAVVAVLRDPLGAVVAVSSRASTSTLAWCDLHTRDGAQAAAVYGDMFGWPIVGAHELGPGLGVYRPFAWRPGSPVVGGFTELARRPGVHTHWLFSFAVADIDAAAARVRGGGGRVTHEPLDVQGGARLVSCEDPQGAAFALRQAV